MNLQLFALLIRNMPFILGFMFSQTKRKIFAKWHALTYKPAPTQKVIVVIGASFGGYSVAKALSQMVPSTYKVVVIESSPQFHYLFVFPRFCVVGGYEEKAFIPYEGYVQASPVGSIEHLRGTVTAIEEKRVILDDGRSIEYNYLVCAMGSRMDEPWKMQGKEDEEGVKILKEWQHRIAKAENIGIVGGGAVGVELATDIKTKYPEKAVSLIHSRDRLLPRFHPAMHDAILPRLKELDIKVHLNQRPQLPEQGSQQSITLLNREILTFDLLIPCLGLIPNSEPLKDLSPSSIDPKSALILTQQTLQIIDPLYPNIFAIGDVAATNSPKMARSAFAQAEIVADNIIRLISGHPLRKYISHPFEGAIDLTLGGKKQLLFVDTLDGEKPAVIYANHSREDMSVDRAWRFLNAKDTEGKL